MAAAADPAEGFSASRSGRALAFGCSFAACLLAAGALTITLLGRPGTSPSIRLELPQETSPPKPASSLRFSSNEAPVVGPVTKPLYAGKMLLADPALIENSAKGPLPRIADDGRRPMDVYAGAAGGNAKFKIAIVIHGLGRSSGATKTAFGRSRYASVNARARSSGVGGWKTRGCVAIRRKPLST